MKNIDSAEPFDIDTGSLAWWLVPNLIALDAPIVAVVWQRFFSTTAGRIVPLSISLILALVVWSIYLTDRWLDADPGRPREMADRHRFARRHRGVIGIACGLAWITSGIVTVSTIPIEYLPVGCTVAVSVIRYLLFIHRTGLAETAGRKELLVAVIFAAGVCVPLFVSCSNTVVRWGPGVGAFAVLCWMNCALIDHWETNPETPVSPARWSASGTLLVFLSASAPLPIAVCVVISVVLLIALHITRQSLGLSPARVLADVVLLTPLGWSLI